MNDFIDSIDLESGPKQKPKSKAGKLLVEVRDKIIAEVKENVKKNGFYVINKKVAQVRRLNKKIAEQLKRELQEQTPLGFVVDKNVNRKESSDKLSVKSKAVKALNKRIKKRLEKENKSTFIQTMFTNHRTTIEYKQYDNSRRMRCTFAGTIAEAKSSLKKYYGVGAVLWAHFYRAEQEVIGGMWLEMDVY